MTKYTAEQVLDTRKMLMTVAQPSDAWLEVAAEMLMYYAAYLREREAAKGGVTNTPQGTFECPVCGLDKPHHHSEKEASIHWHSDYREIFETVVFNNLAYIPRDGLYIGRERSLRVLGVAHHLANKAKDARYFSGRVIEGCKQYPWSEFRNARVGDDGYAQPWMQSLWEIFKQTVIAVINERAALSAALPMVGKVEVPEGWKLVPIEPTQEMIDAGTPEHECAQGDPWYSSPFISDTDCRAVYKAMLCATPTPPASEEKE